jgi:2-C-methyl-D-erythritol 2,4-cyclodiphosphate synthase
MAEIRIGQGFDVHPLVNGRRLVLGGVEIPFEKGLLGHSDADVLLHAISDALLGAAGLGDIGHHFPPSDPAFKDVDSMKLLREVARLVKVAGFHRIVNIDATVMAERPPVNPHIAAMKERIGDALGISPSRIAIKATTCERLGFVGREEGIAALAVCLISADD